LCVGIGRDEMRRCEHASKLADFVLILLLLLVPPVTFTSLWWVVAELRTSEISNPQTASMSFPKTWPRFA
jgi:hypothetical protein